MRHIRARIRCNEPHRIPTRGFFSGSPNTPPLEGRGRVVRRTVNDRTRNSGRERSERHSDADYAFLYNKVMASLVPLALSEGNLIASQSDAWIRGYGSKKPDDTRDISPPIGGAHFICLARRSANQGTPGEGNAASKFAQTVLSARRIG